MEDIKLDDKINKIFAGCVVRKDLVKTVKGNAAVPSYVLEYQKWHNGTRPRFHAVLFLPEANRRP